MDRITINHRPKPAVQAAPGAATSDDSSRKDLFSTLAVIILAPLVALLLTLFIFQSYEVDGPSMQPTLHNRDRLIVSKTAKTWSKITGNAFTPDRYDIIVFSHASSSLESPGKKQLIKRVIGLPGDRVVVKNGKVMVYNNQYPQGILVDESGPEAGAIRYTEGNIEQTVRGGEVYVMGDNRENSLDSRAFGPVPVKDIVGTLSVRIYPFNDIQKF